MTLPIEEQLKRIQQIMKKDYHITCQCGLKYFPFKEEYKDFCPKCHSAIINEDEENEEEIEEIDEVNFNEDF